MAKRNPIRLGRSLTLENVDIHRHPDCFYERKCRNRAVKKKWQGFSCLDCFFFRKYKREKLDEKK